MENEKLETDELDSQEDKTSENDEPQGEDQNVETLLAQKKHFRDKFLKEKEQREELEKKLKEQPKEQPKEEKKEIVNENYSLKDIRALQDVHDDDVEQLTEYAKFKGISIAEAKKTTVMQTLLKEQEELRKTAEATSTGTVKRGSTKASDESIVEQANQGIFPDTDEGIKRLSEARMALKKKK